MIRLALTMTLAVLGGDLVALVHSATAVRSAAAAPAGRLEEPAADGVARNGRSWPHRPDIRRASRSARRGTPVRHPASSSRRAPAAPASSPVAWPWTAVAACEWNPVQRWATNTGNGFYGGLQFTQQTWLSFGGGQYAARADLASPAQQVFVGRRVLAAQGWAAWPVCSREVGLR